MLKDNLKTLRKNKGLSQEELSIKLNVVRQTISKWETGLSVPDAEMLVTISELFETPVSEILGENIEKKEKDDLKVISEKLEVINEQLSNYQKEKKKKRIQVLIMIDISIILLFILLAILNSPYQNWDYSITEWAILGTFYQAFEWIFMRLAPIAVIILSTIILIKRNK
ncbi:MAG: helix-turn-helix transcriptional regulator [Bacilli bacterium]|nr:helix-turn-helix transcriptional regulator [Bacilli bacterium]